MIKDSGNRTEFESGAVRDIQEGKGRADLLPLDIVQEFLFNVYDGEDTPLGSVSKFQNDGDYRHLLDATFAFASKEFPDLPTAVIEYSIHLEEGCRKYGDRNWQKGIPLKNYVSSAVRHYLKHIRGDKDERHDRAFIWNCLCGAWTAKHMPELNEYL